VNLLNLALSHSGVNDVSPLRHLFHRARVIDKTVDQWRTRLRACVKTKCHHFEDCQSHSQISEEDDTQNRSFV